MILPDPDAELDLDARAGCRLCDRRRGRIQSTGPVGTGLSAADEIRAQALEVAGGWSPPGAPQAWRLTAALFEAIAACDELLEHLAELPPDRLPALLASAAITFMVRRDRPVPLAGDIPEPDAPQPPFDEGFFPAFRAFCAAHLEEIVDVCRSHRYQMNEVARCTQIALGIAATSGESPDPIVLVDLGTGAGLGVKLDDYRYRIGGGTYGPAAARLSLTCDVRGASMPPPVKLPRIAGQVRRRSQSRRPRGSASPGRGWRPARPPRHPPCPGSPLPLTLPGGTR